MAPLDSIHFIEAALSKGASSPFGLSYSDPDQKWLIRKDLLSLLQEFPSLDPSIDTFFHDDGTSLNLLVARGSLPVPGGCPAVPVTIWLNEYYPMVRPMVFVSPPPGSTINQNHPFLDSCSGLAKTPYLATWTHPRCSLSDMARNLVKLFSKDHPFWSPPASPSAGPARPVLVSRTEALDRLSGTVHYDMSVLRSTRDREVDDLLRLQEVLGARADTASGIVGALQHEKADLEGRARELEREAGRLSDWLEGLELLSAGIGTDPEDATEETVECAFEAADERSRLILDCVVSERGIDDTIYALDKGIEIGAMSIEAYLKQIRILAREQFYCILTRMKLDGEEANS